MSPLHFKLFVLTAASNIKGYEDRFGKILVPKDGPAEEPAGKQE